MLVLSLILLTATSIIAPYFSKGFFFDEILDVGGSLYGEVLIAVTIVIATQLLMVFADMVNGYISTKIAAKIVYDLINRILVCIDEHIVLFRIKLNVKLFLIYFLFKGKKYKS